MPKGLDGAAGRHGKSMSGFTDECPILKMISFDAKSIQNLYDKMRIEAAIPLL